MKLSRIMAIIMAMSIMLVATIAMAAEPDNLHTIEVTGSATMDIAPNQGVVKISIENTDKDPKVAAAKNAKIMTDIQHNILALAIPGDKLQTTNYSLYPVYADKGNGQQITGYTANNTVAVTVEDINKIGAVIDASLAAGANTVESVDLGVKNQQQYQDKVLADAVRNAQNQANVIAQTLGKSIIGVKRVYNNSVSTGSNRMMAFAAKMADSAPTSPIQGGTVQLRANVSATFIIN